MRLARLLQGRGVPLRSLRVPTRLQFQETECGVAALAMVLAHHGRPVPLHELRKVTGVSRDCVNAADLAKAARHYGMACRSYVREPAQLDTLPLPLLVHLRFIHFGVVEGLTRDEVLLNDPACGRVRMARAVFDEAFTGVVLVVSPLAPTQREPGAAPVPAARRRRGLAVPALGVAASLALVAAAFLLGRNTALAPGALALAAGALAAWQHALGDGLAGEIARHWRERLVAHLRAAGADFHVNRLPQRLANALLACDEAGALEARIRLRTAGGVVLALAAPAALAALHPGAAAKVAAILAGTVAAAGALWRLAGDASLSHATLEPPQPSPVVAPEAMERHQFAGGAPALLLAWASSLAENHAQRVASLHFEAKFRALAATAAVLAPGAVALLHAESPGAAGTLPAAMALALLAVAPLPALAPVLFARARLRQLRAPMEDILATPLESASQEPVAAAPPGLLLDARGLTFGFNPTRAPQVSEVDLALRPGEQLGLTGPSGGGKSTLAALLAGHHRPWRGSVARAHGGDGLPVPVGWVNRAHFFIAGTVRDNLCLWQPVDAAVLQRAVHDACIDDVLAARPGGLDAVVLPQARNFSGGQRQRLEIARALLRQPALLVLDEAIDGLDAALETRLRGRLRARGCALVIVSHRAGTLAACDRVLRVDGGRVGHAVAGGAQEDACAAADGTVPAGPPAVDVASTAMPERGIDASTLEHALHRIARWAGGIAPARPPQGPAGADGVEAMAPAFGLRARRVRVLQPAHWQRQALPLLAFRRDDGAPLLLVPGRERRAIEPGTGRAVAIDPVRDLLPDAWSFTAQAVAATGPLDLLRSCVARARADLIAWVGCVALAAGAVLALPAWLASAPAAAGARAWLGLALLALGAGLAERLRHLAAHRTALHVEREALMAQAEREARLRPVALRDLGPAELGRRLQGLPELLRRLRAAPLRGAQDAVTVAAGLVLLAALAGPVAIAAGAIAVALALLPDWLVRHARACDARRVRAAQATHALAQALFAGFERLRALAADGRALAHWRQRHEPRRRDRADAAQRAGRVAAVAAAMPALAILAASCALAGGADGWTAAALLAFAFAWLPACARLGAGVAALAGLRQPWRAAAGLWRLPVDAPAAPLAQAPALAARGLGYRWPGSTAPTLRDVSLAIGAGEHVALTGPSGGGKSTLLRLLLGLDHPAAGAVLVDGARPDPAGWAALRAATAIVAQGERLEASTTLRAQLSNQQELSVAEVWSAIEEVGLAPAIAAMPMGLQTISDGARLSGGQEQQLLIARALLRRPRLLVLDEATNAIPDDAQARLLQRLRRRGITCILVTHRASALAAMDRVLVLEEGRLAWEGSPAQLAGAPGVAASWQAERQEGHL